MSDSCYRCGQGGRGTGIGLIAVGDGDLACPECAEFCDQVDELDAVKLELSRMRTERNELMALCGRLWTLRGGNVFSPVRPDDQKLIQQFAWMDEHYADQAVLDWLEEDEGVPEQWQWSPLAYAWAEMPR